MSAQKKQKKESPREIRNAKAFHNFFIEETFEAGLALRGTEIKSVRAGKAQIADAFVRFDRAGEAWLYHAHIDEYAFGNLENHDPLRPRKLLLHARELRRLRDAIERDRLTVIPLKLYFKQALLKAQIAICKGKHLYDKREDLKRKQDLREAQRALSRRR